MGDHKIYYLELLRASEGTLSRWSWLHLQSLAPMKPHWARVVGYGPLCLCVSHKEGLYPSSGDINRMMMMMMINFDIWKYIYTYNIGIYPELARVIKTSRFQLPNRCESFDILFTSHRLHTI
jgi:hypothetical protein